MRVRPAILFALIFFLSFGANLHFDELGSQSVSCRLSADVILTVILFVLRGTHSNFAPVVNLAFVVTVNVFL